MDKRRLAQVPFAFCALGGEQMTPRRLRAQNFAAGSDLESFSHCFLGFAAGDRFRHKARKIEQAALLTTAFQLDVGR